ncbi:hypothetical protein H4R18_000344 [Coemansia javaensis]|uniref:Uncharacterized protein n=1 Tax=Coemansia javaensis TaxID=2761396 RepID=A0A9W8HN21_9FUNG|nr:hypothetical protein H4R18_000344 [Coemansia javaensis]
MSTLETRPFGFAPDLYAPEKPPYATDAAVISSTQCCSIDLAPHSRSSAVGAAGPVRPSVRLHQIRHTLCLVMLCTTVCWLSLTATFALLIVRDAVAVGGSGSYTAAYAAVLVALLALWCAAGAICVWTYTRFRRRLAASLAAAAPAAATNVHL